VKGYALDTHALVFWANGTEVSPELLRFLDDCDARGELFASAACFWELALLVKRGRIALSDVKAWKDQLLARTSLRVLPPTADDMIASTLLPDHHKDPFDRLLVAQAKGSDHMLVTRDKMVGRYAVKTFWM